MEQTNQHVSMLACCCCFCCESGLGWSPGLRRAVLAEGGSLLLVSVSPKFRALLTQARCLHHSLDLLRSSSGGKEMDIE